MKPEYKLVKELRPHCPVCKERLRGDNSIILPYKCSCGTWKQDYMTLEFKVEKNEEEQAIAEALSEPPFCAWCGGTCHCDEYTDKEEREYCECDLQYTLEELDMNQCACCGGIIE